MNRHFKANCCLHYEAKIKDGTCVPVCTVSHSRGLLSLQSQPWESQISSWVRRLEE